MNDNFADIVGQEAAKRQLRFFLDSYKTTRVMPNSIFIAGKGQGKTTLARAVAKGLTEFDENGLPVVMPSRLDPSVLKPKPKTFWEINCASLKNVKTFFEAFVVPNVNDKDVTVLFDEASEIPHDISMAMLTILNPNPNNRTTYSVNDYTVDFDFRRQTFLFASSEPNKLFHALLDRLERFDLEGYSMANLFEILRKGTPEVEYEDGIGEEIASTLRGNARAAQKMATKVMAYLKGSKVFLKDDWKELRGVLGIHPLGLTPIEINVLQLLASYPTGTSLTALAARTGLRRTALQQDTETWLLRNNLMCIEQGSGRMVTAKGLTYLKELGAA